MTITKKLAALLSGVVLSAGIFRVVQASPADYVAYFKVDLNEPLPKYADLERKYLVENARYNRRYDYHWDIGNLFDSLFRVTITDYGSTERRLRNEHEQDLLDILSMIPPEYYQYIGPYLHTVPNMPEKVLNMPGIKETKNKFPTRIAPQLADIEDLEFLSPYLYYLLMPEMWPENRRSPERPVMRKAAPKVPYDGDFYARIRELVPADEFVPGAKPEVKTGASDLRTINPDINSPLTSADIKAFARTLPKVREIAPDSPRMARIYNAGSFLDRWEQENGKGLTVNMLKDMVNPCQRLVQKLRMAGMELQLRMAVGGEGFTPESWAYTCDKTIKAYRMGMMRSSTLASLKAFRDGAYNRYLEENLGGRKAALQFQTMQTLVEMYRAPLNDILEARKNRKLLKKEFEAGKYRILGQPVAVLN